LETPHTARNWVQFKKRSVANTDRTNSMKKPLDTIWKQKYRPPITDEAKGLKEELTNCICYQFNPKCWAVSGKLWTRHLRECRRCKQWASKDCKVKFHSATDKERILDEISNSKVSLMTFSRIVVIPLNDFFFPYSL
jgi:hypothetical protein